MSNISQQRNIGFGLNQRQLKAFVKTTTAKQLGITLKNETIPVSAINIDHPVMQKAVSLVQNGDVLCIHTGGSSAIPLKETGEDAIIKLAAKLGNVDGIIMPKKAHFDMSVCFRPLSESVKQNSQRLIEAISRVAKS